MYLLIHNFLLVPNLLYPFLRWIKGKKTVDHSMEVALYILGKGTTGSGMLWRNTLLDVITHQIRSRALPKILLENTCRRL